MGRVTLSLGDEVHTRSMASSTQHSPMRLLPDEAFRLKLTPEAESHRAPMQRAKHMPSRGLPVPRAGENPQRQPTWSARSPPLPFLPVPLHQQPMWAPPKTAPAKLSSPSSRKLLERYRAAQPGCRPNPPRRSAAEYRAGGLAALASGQHHDAVQQLTAAVHLSQVSKQQVLADRASALHRSGKSQAALEDLAECFRLGPTALELYEKRAQAPCGPPPAPFTVGCALARRARGFRCSDGNPHPAPPT